MSDPGVRDATGGDPPPEEGWDASRIPPRSMDWSGYGLGGGPRVEGRPMGPLAGLPDVEPEVRVLPSRRRRLVALVVTALAIAWVVDAIWAVVAFMRDYGDTELRVIGITGVMPIFLRLCVSAVVLWYVWRWANRPAVK